ncbi:MAG TPA: TOBE domain-containing protein [Fibrobacteria bacterium]|nr:TOBE domain-containing protein [Fibrobacteria bacterium]HOX50306.1 TOBE domain-containing protein [Fibrobacteria bacterium]
MKLSARNQLQGTVSAIRNGAVNAEVDLSLEGGATVVAQITLPSVSALGLSVGTKAIALVKSSWIVVGAGETEPKVSSRNRLKGKVSSITKGAINSEVALDLSGGEKVVASITNDSVDFLGLKTGDTAWALFKASAVILGV